MSCPSKRIVPPVGFSCSRISFEVVVLPQPDSPMTPSVSPAVDREIDAVDGLDPADLAPRKRLPVLTGEVLGQALDLQQRRRHARSFGLGSLGSASQQRARQRRRKDGLARLVGGAARQRVGAARVKGAARPAGVARSGGWPGIAQQLLLAAELRHRAEQRLGVRVARRR